MNSNIGIAKQLVRIARIFVAFNGNKLEKQLKKKSSDLDEKCLKEHLDCLEKMDAKEQKVALYWIGKKRLILPEDLSKFQEAMNLINKQHLDFQKFDGPMEVINRDDKSTIRIKSQDSYFNPATEKAFSHPYNAGDGIVIYNVEDSIVGQLAVRKAIDVNWGYDRNPWCIASRKDGFNRNEINNLTSEQAEKLGFYSDDALAVAWRYWNHYKAYPKRIAFKNGKLLAFSAGDNKQHVEWWDKNDKSHYDIPESNAVDDVEFLKKHGKLNLLENNNASPEMIDELVEDGDWHVREEVAYNPKIPVDILRKLAGDENEHVRWGAIRNPNIPADILRELAEDKDERMRYEVARNPNTPIDILMRLAEDVDKNVRQGVASNPNTPVDILKKLAEDEEKCVRQEVAYNSNTPIDILRKLAEDKYWNVRQGVAMNPNTPAGILRKLAGDEEAIVRLGVVHNPNAPVDILRKLAEDENSYVLKSAKNQLRRRGQSF